MRLASLWPVLPAPGLGSGLLKNESLGRITGKGRKGVSSFAGFLTVSHQHPLRPSIRVVSYLSHRHQDTPSSSTSSHYLGCGLRRAGTVSRGSKGPGGSHPAFVAAVHLAPSYPLRWCVPPPSFDLSPAGGSCPSDGRVPVVGRPFPSWQRGRGSDYLPRVNRFFCNHRCDSVRQSVITS